MSVAAAAPSVEAPLDVDYGPVVQFGLLGLRAEVERARDAVRAGDAAELAAAQAQARRLLAMLRLLPPAPGQRRLG